MFNVKIPKKISNSLLLLWQKNLILHKGEQEKGNTLFIAIILGILAVSATSLALFTSSKDKTNAKADEYSKQAIATAEAGITRATDKLSSQYPGYLTLTYDPTGSPPVNQWASPPPNTGSSPCATAANSSALQAVIAENLDSNRSYQIKKYNYDSATEQGTLELKGTNNNGGLSSKAQLEVKMQIEQFVPPGSFPGLYASVVINMGNNDVLSATNNANVICTNCTPPTNGPTLTCTNGVPNLDYLQAAIGLGSGGTIQGNIIIGAPVIPPYPAPPTAQCSATQALPCYILVDPITSAPVTYPRATDVTNRTTWAANSASPWATVNTPLSEPYTYIVKKAPNGDSISLNGNGTEIITINSTVAKVRFYVAGDISISGQPSIQHSGTIDRFAIFGCVDSLNTLLGSLSPAQSCLLTGQDFTLGGGSTATNVFVYAPNTTMGINGGSSTPDLNAVVWVKAWNGSNSTNAEIAVPSDAENLITSEYGLTGETIGIPVNRIASLNSWTRKGAN